MSRQLIKCCTCSSVRFLFEDLFKDATVLFAVLLLVLLAVLLAKGNSDDEDNIVLLVDVTDDTSFFFPKIKIRREHMTWRPLQF